MDGGIGEQVVMPITCPLNYTQLQQLWILLKLAYYDRCELEEGETETKVHESLGSAKSLYKAEARENVVNITQIKGGGGG